MKNRQRLGETENPLTVMFLHDVWRKSHDFKKHQELVAKAAREGRPRPSIPPEVREKYTIRRADLNEAVQETYQRLVPVELSDGTVSRNHLGEVNFRVEKPIISRNGCCSGIKAMYKDNSYDFR